MKKKIFSFLKPKKNKSEATNKENGSSAAKHKKIENELIGIFMILFSIFSFLSLFTMGTGFVGRIFRYGVSGMFGFSSFLLPFIFLFLGIRFFVSEEQRSIGSKIFDIFAINAGVSILTVLFYYDVISLRQMSIIESLNYSFKVGAEQMKGGGLIGEGFCTALVSLIGKSGAWIISIGMIFIFVLVLTETSIQIALKKILEKVKFSIAEISEVLKFKKKINKGSKAGNTKFLETNEEKKFKITKHNFSENKNEYSLNLVENFEEENFIEGEYNLPPTSILLRSSKCYIVNNKKILEEKANKLINTLRSFGVEATITNISCGPTVTRFELFPGIGVKVNKITNLSDDIALSLAALSVRIEAPIPGKSAIGVEIPNEGSTDVPVRDVIDTHEFRNFKSKVTFALGKDISGKCVIADISQFPHVLIAGATGSGKSVCINSLIASILYKAKPDEVKFIMIDPKMVELGVYNGIPHLLVPVVTNPKRAAGALNWAVVEMQKRYKLFAERGVRNLDSFNEHFLNKNQPEACLPEIVIIIDELADLMMIAKDEVEDAINRLAALARAAGMYLVIATQRPSVNVVTGVIKANVPSRISFAVTSQVDSRTIIDSIGAEKLLGRGDMLYYPRGTSKPIRVQGNFISDSEIENLVEFVKKQGETLYDETIIEQIENDDEDYVKVTIKNKNLESDGDFSTEDE